MKSIFLRSPLRALGNTCANLRPSAAALLALSALLLAAPTAQAQLRNDAFVATNGIAAQVDDQIITLDQLRQQIGPIVPEIRRRSSNAQQFEQNISAVTRDVLQNLIDEILIVKEFNSKGYVLPEQFVRTEYDNYITKNFNGDRARFLESLKIQGTNELAFRNKMKDGIIASFMRGQMIKSATEVSPEQVWDYYQNHRSQFYEEAGVKLYMIMLKKDADNEALVRQQVATIQKELAEGKDFSELAKKYSQGPNAAQGGDWGWRRYSDLRKELNEATQKLEKGKVSEPLDVDGVVYILYAEDKRGEGIKGFDAVRGDIEQAISGQLARQAQQRWLERLRRQAYIRYYLQEAGPSPTGNSSTISMRLGTNAAAERDAERQQLPMQITPTPDAPATEAPIPVEQTPRRATHGEAPTRL